VDLFETNDAVELRVDLPGVAADAIDIQVRGRRLTITGQRPEDYPNGCTRRRLERPTGRFARSVALPRSVRSEQVSVQCRDGVLAISLPKMGKEAHGDVQRDSTPSASCCQASGATYPF
jgi:HSP20 family protein